MADTTVEANSHSVLDRDQGLWGPYWISPDVGVLVALDVDQDVNAYRTADGGASWTPIEITTAASRTLSVYFDQETPGDTGTLLHVWWLEITDGVLRYNTVDISDGSLGTERTIATTHSGFSDLASGSYLAGTKTRNGNLLVIGRSQSAVNGSVLFAYRSTDSGANWTSRTSPSENATDGVKLFPANTGDDADAALLYYDDSDTELSVKMYDDSAGTWTETSILTSFDAGAELNTASHFMFDAATMHSDGLIYGCGFNNPDVAGNDLVTFTVNPNSIASPTIDTTTANVLTDITEAGYCALAINQKNGDIYVAYAEGTAMAASLDVHYKVSTDGMASWGPEQTYSEAPAEDLKAVTGPRSIGEGGGRIQWAFFDDDDDDIFVNLTNDVAITVTPDTVVQDPIGPGIVAFAR